MTAWEVLFTITTLILDTASILVIIGFFLRYELQNQRKWIYAPMIFSAWIISIYLLTITTNSIYYGIVYWIFMFLLIICIYRMRIYEAMMLSIFLSLLTASIRTIIRYFVTFLFHMANHDLIDIIACFLNLCIWISVSICYCRKNKSRIIKLSNGYMLFATVIIFFNTLLMSNLLDYIMNDSRLHNNRRLGFVVIIVMAGLLIEMIILTLNIVTKNWYKQINLMNEEILKMTEEHYRALQNKETETRKFRHDYKGQLQVIARLAEKDKNEEIIDYVEELGIQLKGSQQIFYSGDKFLDAILTDKAQYAKERNIRFAYSGKVTELRKLSPLSISTLFVNMLDNAIEAAQNAEEDKRYIDLTITETDHNILIQCKNGYRNIAIENNQYKTTKENPQNHGIGLQNIKEVVKKYNGNMEISDDEKNFKIEIMIPVNKK